MRVKSLMVLGVLVLAAPESVRADLSLEVLGGLGLTQTAGERIAWRGEVDVESSTSPGVAGGVGVRLPVGPSLSAGLDLVFSSRAFQYSYDPGGSQAVVHTTVEAPWLTVPVVLRLALPAGFSAGIGGYVAFALSGEYSYRTRAGGGGTTETQQNVPDSLDLGLVGTLGYAQPIAPMIQIGGELRYLFGLKDFEAAGSGSDLDAVTLRELQVLAGVSFGI